MILKDLETVGDKPLKKEMDEPSLSAELLNDDGGQVQQQICLFTIFVIESI